MSQGSSKLNNIVFYGDQVYAESPDWIVPYDLPDGAYKRSSNGNWYAINWGSAIPIHDSDVPPELKTLCLLLGI